MDEQGLWSYANQVSRAGFKACMEQDEDRANLRDRFRKAGGMDPAESKRTDDRAREDFSEHCRKLEALENFSDDLGSRERLRTARGEVLARRGPWDWRIAKLDKKAGQDCSEKERVYFFCCRGKISTSSRFAKCSKGGVSGSSICAAAAIVLIVSSAVATCKGQG